MSITHEERIINWGISREIIGVDGKASIDSLLNKLHADIDDLEDSHMEADPNAFRDALGAIFMTSCYLAERKMFGMDECITEAIAKASAGDFKCLIRDWPEPVEYTAEQRRFGTLAFAAMLLAGMAGAVAIFWDGLENLSHNLLTWMR